MSAREASDHYEALSPVASWRTRCSMRRHRRPSWPSTELLFRVVRRRWSGSLTPGRRTTCAPRRRCPAMSSRARGRAPTFAWRRRMESLSPRASSMSRSSFPSSVWTPASGRPEIARQCLALGAWRLVEEQGFHFHWQSGKAWFVVPDARRHRCEVKNLFCAAHRRFFIIIVA